MINEKWLLIGHRGTGKSSFLQGLSHRFEQCIDLDHEIEKRSQKSIVDIFTKYGEVAFRQIEAATFDTVLKENASNSSVLIALGAGFAAHVWPREYRCLWLRRETDVWPRYFKDRPQIATSSPDSFLGAYIEREKRYQDWADVAWTLEESFGSLETEKCEWPLAINVDAGATLTLVPRLHNDPLAAMELRKRWGLRFEIRSDLWSVDKIREIITSAHSPLLLSIRTQKFPIAEILPLLKGKDILWDWDFDFGELPNGFSPSIISKHDFSTGLDVSLKNLEELSHAYPQALLKASPILDSFSELEQLWKWYLKDPQRHMIFPRTKSTRENSMWQWFRLLLKGKQRINFVREATEGPKDQPTLPQYMRHMVGTRFAAILGHPVFHSYSPSFHRGFFEKKKMPFLAIPLLKNELTESVFKFLESLGACAYAVTSPLKEHPVLLESSESADSGSNDVCNTLLKTTSWKRYNTDLKSIQQLFASSLQSWRIWGSGAVAKQCFESVANAEMYSSRSHEKLAEKGVVVASSFNLLWAAGDEAEMPPDLWKPNKLCDLSYTQRSHAILYANKAKVDYENGVEFFKIQGLAQQELWEEL